MLVWCWESVGALGLPPKSGPPAVRQSTALSRCLRLQGGVRLSPEFEHALREILGEDKGYHSASEAALDWRSLREATLSALGEPLGHGLAIPPVARSSPTTSARVSPGKRGRSALRAAGDGELGLKPQALLARIASRAMSGSCRLANSRQGNGEPYAISLLLK